MDTGGEVKRKKMLDGITWPTAIIATYIPVTVTVMLASTLDALVKKRL